MFCGIELRLHKSNIVGGLDLRAQLFQQPVQLVQRPLRVPSLTLHVERFVW